MEAVFIVLVGAALGGLLAGFIGNAMTKGKGMPVGVDPYGNPIGGSECSCLYVICMVVCIIVLGGIYGALCGH